MVAPTGVNEELPGEPAKAGTPGAGTAEAEPSQAEETGEEAAPAAVVPAEVVPADVVPQQAEPVGGEAKPAEAEPVEAELATAAVEAEPAVEGPAVEAPAEAGAAEADWDAEEGHRDVSPLAVVGIIFGVIALVGVAVGVLAVVTHGFRPKTVVTYRPAAAFGLRPGQCVNSGSDALKVTVVSCASQHDAEVFAAFTLPAGPWPGSSAVRVDAGDGCASRLDSYIDPQLATASLTQAYIYPNQGAWQAGERRVVCEVSAVSGRLTGSVRAQG
jgi:Septum formation